MLTVTCGIMQNQAQNYMTEKEHVIIVARNNPVTLLTGQFNMF